MKARALIGGWGAWRNAGLPVQERAGDGDLVAIQPRRS